LWHTINTLDNETAFQSLKVLIEIPPPVSDVKDDFALFAMELDKKEMALLAEQPDLRNSELKKLSLPGEDPDYLDPERYRELHPNETGKFLRLLLRRTTLFNLEPPAEEIETFGIRGRADLALEEGELLALRLPGPAERLLRQALHWFQEAGDSVGAMQAAVLITIIAIRTQPVESIRPIVAEILNPAYEWMASQGSTEGLPSQEELQEALAKGSPSTLFSYGSWNGWLERAIVCLAWSKDPNGQMETTKRLREELGKKYRGNLPAEMDLPFGAAEEKKASVPKSPEEASSKLSRSDWLVAVLSILLSIGILSGGYFLLGWLIGLATPNGVGTILQLSIYAGIIAAFALSPRGYRAVASLVRAWLTANSRIELVVDSGQTTFGRRLELDRPIEVKLHLFQRRRRLLGFPPLGLQPAEQIEAATLTPGIRPYRNAAQDFPESITNALSALRKDLRARRLPVLLNVDLPASAYPWEAILSLVPYADKFSPHRGSLEFWRVSLSATSTEKSADSVEVKPVYYELTQPAVASPEKGGVHIIADSAWRSTVIPAWSTLDEAASIDPEPYAIKGLSRAPSILHLLGKPIQSGSGVLLSIDSSSEQAYVQKSSFRSDILIEPDELPLDSVELVIIQLTPAELLDFRQDTEREKMGYLRALAAQIAERDVGTVIALPLLSPQLTEAVLMKIVRSLKKQKVLSVKKMMKVTGEVRRIIAGWRPSQASTAEKSEQIASNGTEFDPTAYAEVMTELALDVSIFIKQRYSKS
jgi:hypothetical protein